MPSKVLLDAHPCVSTSVSMSMLLHIRMYTMLLLLLRWMKKHLLLLLLLLLLLRFPVPVN